MKPIIGVIDYGAGNIFSVENVLRNLQGVLIHINSDYLPEIYKRLYDYSEKNILLAEYYNPTPVTISYRGHDDRLFKRDFAGETMEQYPDPTLVDYGFLYHKDPVFPQDDITWFLMEKRKAD